MMLDGIGLFQGIMAKMNWLDQNQRVIAQNVANADTPGYHAKSLVKPDFGSMMKLSAGGSSAPSLQMASTDEGMAMGQANGTIDAKAKAGKIKYEASPDNNGVVLEEQLFQANQNSTDYQLATDLYRRNAGMLRMVLQGSSGR